MSRKLKWLLSNRRKNYKETLVALTDVQELSLVRKHLLWVLRKPMSSSPCCLTPVQFFNKLRNIIFLMHQSIVIILRIRLNFANMHTTVNLRLDR